MERIRRQNQAYGSQTECLSDKAGLKGEEGLTQLPSPGNLQPGPHRNGSPLPLACSQGSSRSGRCGKLHPEDSLFLDQENKHTWSYLPPASAGRSVRYVSYVQRAGLRQGSVLNILFCFVPFWPIRTGANFGHGDRGAHLQSMELTESCYSHKEVIRTCPLPW